MIDSGATANVISDRCGLLSRLPIYPIEQAPNVEAVDGRPIVITRMTYIRLEMLWEHGRLRQRVTPFLIGPSVHADLIFGLPWMMANNVFVGGAHSEIVVGRPARSLTLPSAPRPTLDQVAMASERDERDDENEPSRFLEHPTTESDPGSTAADRSSEESRHLSRHQISREVARNQSSVYLAMVSAVDNGRMEEPLPAAAAQAEGLEELRSKVMGDYPDVLRDELPVGLPPQRSVVHRIDEKEGSTPVHGPIYRLSDREQQELRKYLAEEIEAGRIQPSTSPYGSPVLFVPKKDGRLRLCVDYRALNKQTVKNRYPLPRIDDLLDQLRHAKVFSKIDLKSGYNQVEVLDEHAHKTAFKTRYGHYEYRVMPFGLCNAPATFQRLMNDILRPFLDLFVIVYLDDILVYSPTLEAHENHLRKVMESLREHRLYAAPNKCEFFRLGTEFLGHIVSGAGVEMDPRKVEAIRAFPPCKNVHETQVFMGMANFYRRFIKDFSRIAAPLTALLKKECEYVWGKEQQDAFDKLKDSFVTAPVLRIYSPSNPIRVATDASDFAIAAVLEQEFDGNWHPVAFESRKMSPAEQNYPIREKELLAVVHALTTWRLYLQDSPGFEVLTDHHSLQYLQTQKHLNRRQARWAEELCNFNYTIKHIAGRVNSVPDALSRRPDFSINSTTVVEGGLLDQVRAATPGSPLHVMLSKPESERGRTEKTQAHSLSLENGLIRKGERVYLPTDELQLRVLRESHDAPLGGHLGQDKTLEVVRRSFYWPGMDTFVRRYVKSCDVCQRIKPSTHQPYGLLQPLPAPGRPWQSISMDFITCLPPSNGFSAVFTVVDRLTKMAHFLACNMEDLSAPATVDLLLRVVALHGLPESIVSDRDPRFTSRFWKCLWERLGVSLKMSSAHHAQTDGQTERTHRTIEHILRAYCSHRQDAWASQLPLAEFAFNNAVSATTKVTPFFANYGYHPATPTVVGTQSPVPAANERIEDLRKIHEQARLCITQAQRRQAKFADAHRQEMSFDVGAKVLLDTEHLQLSLPSRKLAHRRVGPFKVVSKVGPVAYKLELPSTMSSVHPVFHVSKLEPWEDPTQIGPSRQLEPPPQPEIIDDALEYEVEALLARRKRRGKWQYLVKWKGYADHESSWEPADNLENAQELMADYDRQHPLRS